jgi:Ran GTPase-activating protein (RanGAP) involved in mRNA processing and transport
MATNSEVKESPHLHYLKSCKTQGILPIPYGISETKDKSKNIILKNVSMGDKYAEAFSNILPFKQTGYTLNLSNNRLSQKGADHILEKVNSHISKLDISFNPNVKALNFEKLITDFTFRLTAINLEGNNIGDNLVIKLNEAVRARPLMKTMNLSKNLITNKGAKSLADLLRDNISIVALYLKWNNIKANGGVYL